MAKKEKEHKSAMLLDIELADNGIIIRDPIDPDCITLATYGQGAHRAGEFGYDIDKDDIYKKLGRILYTWLFEDVLQESEQELITTGFNLVFHAKCVGRARE